MVLVSRNLNKLKVGNRSKTLTNKEGGRNEKGYQSTPGAINAATPRFQPSRSENLPE